MYAQTIITVIVLLAALSYAVWHLYKLLKGREDPCNCCEMKKNCKKFCQSKEK